MVLNVLLISYNNGSHIPFFPQGIAYLASSWISQGHDVALWLDDAYHRPAWMLTEYLDRNRFDIVGLGFVAGYYQYKQALRISDEVNRSKNRHKFTYVLGGHGPAAEPAYFIRAMGADCVVIGEAEQVDCADLVSGKYEPNKTEYPGSDDVRWPAYGLFPIDIYRLIRWPTSTSTDFCMPILSGRGCKWHCSFCYRMGDTFRPRSPGAVIEEMDYLSRTYHINHFQFSDELFMSSHNRIHDFCEKLIQYKEKHPRFKFDCNGRVNFATHENLSIMKRAGCEYINYGCESLNQNILNAMNKGQTVKQIYRAVESTIDLGMSPGLNFIWGFPGDTVKNLDMIVDFLIQHDPCHELRTIRPVTPYPGSDLYHEAIRAGLLAGPEDFYCNKHVNSDLLTVNFTDLSDAEFHRALLKANERLIKNYYHTRRDAVLMSAEKLYLQNDTSFRGFRAI